MEALLPWWGWLVSGAGATGLLWLVATLAIAAPRRRELEGRMADRQRQVEHLDGQRADREARVLSVEQRLSESERGRLLAETGQAESAAAIAAGQAALQELEGLRQETARLQEQSEQQAAAVRAAQEREATLRADLAARSAEHEQLVASSTAQAAELALAREQAEALQQQATAASRTAALRSAELRVADGEREALLLGSLVSRSWRGKSADLLALSSFGDELADYRDGLYKARRSIEALERDGDDATAADNIATETTARTAELRAMARQVGLLDETGALAETTPAEESGPASLARGIVGYLRDTFGRLTTPPATPAEPTEQGDDESFALEAEPAADQPPPTHPADPSSAP